MLSLAGAKDVHKRYIRCILHDDKTPSAEIRQSSSTGAWYYYCHTCSIADDYWSLRARLEGRDVGEVLKEAREDAQPVVRAEVVPFTPPAPAPVFPSIDALIDNYRSLNPQMQIEEVNRYTHPDSKAVELVTIRHRREPGAKKQFIQATPASGGWQARGLSGTLPLFNRTRIRACARVLIVEGEKCVRAVTNLAITNLAATTPAGGASSASRADWSPVAGKTCYIWPDNDNPGRKFAGEIKEILEKLGCAVVMIEPNDLGLEEKQDVVDYIEMCGSDDEATRAVENLLGDNEPPKDSDKFKTRIGKIASGEFKHVVFPHLWQLSKLTQAIVPECVTILVGDPGSAKSWTLLEALWSWAEAGQSVRGLMLEGTVEFWQARALAQMSGYSDVTDIDYIKQNAELVEKLFVEHKERLDIFSRHCEVRGSEELKLSAVGDWLEHWAKEGIKVLIVDPITAADAGDKPFQEDRKFVRRAKRIAELYGCSVLLSSHPRGGKAGAPSLSGVAGGMAYTRFTDCVLWMRHYEKPKEVTVGSGYTASTRHIDRAIEIRKARNGKGQGKTIAVELNAANLCLEEIGLVQHG